MATAAAGFVTYELTKDKGNGNDGQNKQEVKKE